MERTGIMVKKTENEPLRRLNNDERGQMYLKVSLFGFVNDSVVVCHSDII